MDEYIIDVIINDKPEKLKLYVNSLHAVIDNMVSLGSVQSIVKILRTEDAQEWSFKDGGLKRLSELRNEIISEADIANELNKYNGYN